MDQAENVDSLLLGLENQTVVADEDLAHLNLTELAAWAGNATSTPATASHHDPAPGQ
jgi:hypothetical protein